MVSATRLCLDTELAPARSAGTVSVHQASFSPKARAWCSLTIEETGDRHTSESPCPHQSSESPPSSPYVRLSLSDVPSINPVNKLQNWEPKSKFGLQEMPALYALRSLLYSYWVHSPSCPRFWTFTWSKFTSGPEFPTPLNPMHPDPLGGGGGGAGGGGARIQRKINCGSNKVQHTNRFERVS